MNPGQVLLGSHFGTLSSTGGHVNAVNSGLSVGRRERDFVSSHRSASPAATASQPFNRVLDNSGEQALTSRLSVPIDMELDLEPKGLSTDDFLIAL